MLLVEEHYCPITIIAICLLLNQASSFRDAKNFENTVPSVSWIHVQGRRSWLALPRNGRGKLSLL